MAKLIKVVGFLIGYTLAAASIAADLEQYGHPAIISISSSSASVSNIDGTTTLTLHDVPALATLTAAVHKHNERVFSAFPTNKLATAWNSCNAMKLKNGLFHDDGVNSLLAYSDGPVDSEDGHVTEAPLITQTETIEKTFGGAEGAARAMLVDASFSENDLSFTVRNSVLIEGSYTQVQLVTECVYFPPQCCEHGG